MSHFTLHKPTSAVFDLPGVGEVLLLPNDRKPADPKVPWFSYKEVSALAHAEGKGLLDRKHVIDVAKIKRTFPGAMINRILSAEEVKADRESDKGISASDVLLQVGQPPAGVKECPACGGKGGEHFDVGCIFE